MEGRHLGPDVTGRRYP